MSSPRQCYFSAALETFALPFLQEVEIPAEGTRTGVVERLSPVLLGNSDGHFA